jgi:hypothetical protein
MRIQSIVQEACPVCGKETTLAVVEPHLTHPEMELHIYIYIYIDVWIADRSKPGPFGCGRGRLRRAA